MINAIIVDDEPHCSERLERMLKLVAPDSIRLLGKFEDVDTGAAAVVELKPDLIFLDIQLKDRTGFELLRQIDPTRLSVIFTTAYDQYAEIGRASCRERVCQYV